MKKILVATDASEYSKRALKTALEIARKFNAEVELLYAMYEPVAYNFSEAGIYIDHKQVTQEGDLVLEAAIKGIDVSDVNLKTKKLFGDPGNVIIQEIENENIDMVVMGSHGYGTIAGSLLGSVSQKVTHKAKCSVLIVK